VISRETKKIVELIGFREKCYVILEIVNLIGESVKHKTWSTNWKCHVIQGCKYL